MVIPTSNLFSRNNRSGSEFLRSRFGQRRIMPRIVAVCGKIDTENQIEGKYWVIYLHLLQELYWGCKGIQIET